MWSNLFFFCERYVFIEWNFLVFCLCHLCLLLSVFKFCSIPWLLIDTYLFFLKYQWKLQGLKISTISPDISTNARLWLSSLKCVYRILVFFEFNCEPTRLSSSIVNSTFVVVRSMSLHAVICHLHIVCLWDVQYLMS